MIVRLVLALLTSPWHGALAIFATIPLMLVSGAVIVALASVSPRQGSLDAAVVAFLLGLLIMVISFLFQVLITVQQVRYAGAFSGAKPLRSQPPFMTSFWRGLVVILLFQVFTVLLLVCAIAILRDLWDAWGLPAPDQQAVLDWAARLGQFLEEGGRSTEETRVFGWTLLGLRGFGMFYATLMALIIVPRVCGIGSEGGRTWTVGYFLFRLLIGVPCAALMTAIITGGLIMSVELVTGDWPEVVSFAVALTLESSIFAGIMFALEAMILRAGREIRDESIVALTHLEHGDSADYRALREQWSDN